MAIPQIPRDELRAFLPTPRLVRAYEALQQGVQTLPDDVAQAQAAANAAQLSADTAQSAASAAQATASAAATNATTALSNASTALTAANNAQTTANTALANAGTVSTDLATHAGATSAHGVTGAVVGTTDTQTLSNKTIAGAQVTADIVFTAAGLGVRNKEGANARMGAATLVAGTVVVNTTAVTASSRIMLSGQNSSGTHGELTVSARTAGTGFTISSSSATDTRLVAWIIFEPAP